MEIMTPLQANNQLVLPPAAVAALALKAGDILRWQIDEKTHQAVTVKASEDNWLTSQMDEWLSPEDCAAFAGLAPCAHVEINIF